MKYDVFISYSAGDSDLIKEFTTRFKTHNKAHFNVWFDRDGYSGQYDEQLLGRYANTCDIAILLMSADFIASEYCNDKELPVLTRRHATSEILVVPVLFEDCIYKSWNEDKKWKFCQILNNDFKSTKSVGDNADDIVNKGYAPYGLLDKKEKSTFHRMLSEKILETIGNSKNFKSKFEGKQNIITTVKTAKDKQQNFSEQGGLRSNSDTLKMLLTMRQNTLVYQIEKELSEKEAHWQRANIQIPSISTKSYAFWYCLQQAKALNKIKLNLSKSDVDTLDFQQDVFEHIKALKDKISQIHDVFDEEYQDKVFSAITDVLDNSESVITKLNRTSRSNVAIQESIKLVGIRQLTYAIEKAIEELKRLSGEAMYYS
jgi:TIR domain